MKEVLIGMLCLLFIPIISAQTRMVSGTVIDQATNEGLPFASIHVPNTLVGTMTNEFGQFEIKLKEGRDTLQISYLGYLDEFIVIDENKKGLEVALKAWGIDLETVIVNPHEPLYYIKQAVKNYSSSISNQPFETEAFYAEKTTILNDQSDAYKMDEAVFKTYYEDFSLDTLNAQNKLVLHRPTEKGEMKTMLERNKKLAKRMDKQEKRDAKKSDEPDESKDSEEKKDSEKKGSNVSINSFTGEGPSGILEAAKEVINLPLFKSKYFKKFKYTFGEPSFYKNRKLMVIHFKNKRKIEYSFYDGTVYLDYENMSIVAINYNEKGKVPWWANALIKGIAGFKVLDIENDVSIKNQFQGGYWYPKELRKKFRVVMKQPGEMETIGGNQVLNVYNIDITNPSKINKAKEFDAEKEYAEQIFNDEELEWSDVNVVKF